ncbi:DUF6338 family protein [Amycolatopsis iheyensis]|uniref:DUF6338 family protein n=1 Tax=Amycolatopsis iheyensis TaxID=2945988 RepID=UPI0035573034
MDAKTWQQLVIVICAVLPGYVFQVADGWWRGATDSDRPVSSRIFALISLTIIFDVLYAWLFSDPIRYILSQLSDPIRFAKLASLMILACVFIVPSLCAVAWHWWRVFRRVGSFKLPVGEFFRGSRYQTSWDYAAVQGFGQGWVRIRFKDGLQLGGFVNREDGHMSQSPGRRDLYLTNLWTLDGQGNFVGEEESIKVHPHGGSGVWVNCEDAIAVEFMKIPPASTGDDEAGEEEWPRTSTVLTWWHVRPRWMLRAPRSGARSLR